MLDLLITYINFFILSLKYIIKKLIFCPPNPEAYKIIENPNKVDNKIEIYVKKSNYKSYHKVKKKVQLDIEFQKIKDNANNFIPVFIFKPTLSLHSACIIFCHGNSCDIGSTFSDCCYLAKKTKCIIVSFDYPGYGIYQNVEPSEKKFYRTVQIVYEFVKNSLNFDENSIIVYGFSLGTGVAFDLACNKNYKFAGLILQSPFLSIIRTMYNTKKTKYFDLFNNCDKAKLLNIKTLFIHGNKDKIVPYIHGRILSKLIPQNLLFGFKTIDGADHNNIFSSYYFETLSEIITNFIEKCCNSIKFKDTKTEKVKEMSKIKYNYELTPNICNSISRILNDNNRINTSRHEPRKKDKDEIENKSFSENNNSAVLIRKKDSFSVFLKDQKFDESHMLKTNSRYIELEDSKNVLDSTDKFLKEKKSDKNIDKSNINIFDKSEKNKFHYNNVKTTNDNESIITQKEEILDNNDVNLGKKLTKKPLQEIINISKSE
jgi:pimeloyl-ACP methyl ester carboxylesterase